MRLIDADALPRHGQRGGLVHWKDIEEAPTIEPKTKVIAQVTFDDDKLREIVHEAVERIKEEYDIVDNPDAVSVVRCKECKWWVVAMDENNSDEDYLKCPMDKWSNADDFCSYGERREP